MAQIRLNDAQQNGAFNNGAVGQSARPMCQYPYVWDRVRKICVLPDELMQVRAYQDRVPMWNWLSYLDWPGELPTRYSGLGATGCPEGSSKNPSYTGPLDPSGSGCRCAEGRVWHNGYCQSPQSVVQQSSAHLSDYAQMTVEEQMAQELSDYAKQYFQQTGHTVRCKLVYPTNVPGGPNYPTMMCSIDGGEYVHGAYAINLNPSTAITSEMSRRAAQQVSQATGIPAGSLQTPELQAAVVKATGQMTAGQPVDITQEVAAGAASAQLKQQLADSLVRGVDYERPDGQVSWRTQIAYGGQSTTDMVQEALNAPPGFMLGQPAIVTDTGTVAGGIGASMGSIPWWVWVAAAGGAYLVFKNK